VDLRAFPSGDGPVFRRILKTGDRRQPLDLPFVGRWTPDFLDLVFVVDATGSMGDELDWLKRDLRRMTKAARDTDPGLSIRYGLVMYRDQGDDFVVRNYGFTRRESQMLGWLRAQDASGGGDYPEAAAEALRTAVSLGWRRGQGERLLIHIADAPPHARDARAYSMAAAQAAERGIQIYGLGASGVGPEAEHLMREAALVTNGRYLFLTDDSAVGLGHAEPSVPCYRVTRLTNLMTRVLRSELTGRRHEPVGADVIREVGSYRAGVCRE
jgi:hypothetical protein